ncbi:carbohydrate esterase family 4 protein [Backusella circina FSU 941]|nr:carbohydrate esterase family 4 protein [Backusella circina FSU 941]
MVSLTLSASTAVLLASIVSAQSVSSTAPTTSTGSYPARTSPAWLSSVTPIAGNVQSYPADGSSIPTGPLPSVNFSTTGYPTAWESPDATSAEVQAVVASIDWSFVPNSTVKQADSNGDLTMTGYDDNTDPDCWWSATGCVTSKNSSIPPDVYQCPEVGTWGLTYDDGPLTPDAGEWAEPNLYNFLANYSQKAGLFYIGSNVIAAPAAAQRALSNGHTICVHTWSHPAMTSQTNDQVVAELYWTLKAIKEVTGITPKCWRPPYGDVDDRVRAIAWQMGLTTVIWDEDTNDWNMPGDGGGNLSPDTVDGYFEGWIDARKNGTDNQSGHIVLEHELNNSTVSMAEKWLPQLQQVFKVVPWNECMNISDPYWETNFVYPTQSGSNSTTSSVTSSVIASSTASAVTPAASSSDSSSSGQNVGSNSANAQSGSSHNIQAASYATMGLILLSFIFLH